MRGRLGWDTIHRLERGTEGWERSRGRRSCESYKRDGAVPLRAHAWRRSVDSQLDLALSSFGDGSCWVTVGMEIPLFSNFSFVADVLGHGRGESMRLADRWLLVLLIYLDVGRILDCTPCYNRCGCRGPIREQKTLQS